MAGRIVSPAWQWSDEPGRRLILRAAIGRLVLVMLFVSVAPALPLTEAGIDSLLGNRSASQARPLPGASGRRIELVERAGQGLSGPMSSGALIREDFVCNDDTTGGCSQAGPRIGVFGDGSFIIAWYGFAAGESDIWFQRFDPEGRPTGENRTANLDSALRWQGDPVVAVRDDGSFLVGWEDRWRVGDSDIFVQRFAADGSAVGGNFRVSDSGVPGDQAAPGAWTAPSGMTLVTWDDRRYGITGDIFGQFLDSGGLPVDTNFMVNDDGINVGNQYRPAVGGDSLGRFVVAWMDGRRGNWNVYGQRFGPGRTRLDANFRVTPSDSWQWSPTVAVSPTGRFLVGWEDRQRAQWDVYARVYDVDGRPGEPFRVNDDPGVTDQFGVAAAANRHDEFLLVWTDRRDGHDAIYAQRYTADARPVGGNFVVSAAGPAPVGRGAAHAAARPCGGYVVAWVDGEPGHKDIHARLMSRDGGMAGAFRVNADSASSHQRVSSLGMYADGRVLIAWEDERNGSADIYSTLLSPTGEPFGPNRRLSDDRPGAAAQYYAAAAAGRSRALVTWTDGRDGFNIFGRYLDSLGRPMGTDFRVNETATGQRWYSSTGMDERDRAVVAWMDTRNGGYRVHARRFDPDGQPVGPEFTVGDKDVTQYYPGVAMAGDGRFLVSWMDYREGGRPDIYCQLYDSCGTRIGDNFRVNDDHGSNYQGYPAAAVGPDGGFAVFWEDTRDDGYDVYLQWFDAGREPVGGNRRVNDGPAQVAAYSPSGAFDRQGRLVVLFNDEREQAGSPQVFVQRYREDRVPVGGNRRVNRPREAPRNHHWTVGQSVAVNDDIIAVTWTGNRRLQGWDIYARFADWNLGGVAEDLPADIMPDESRVFRVWPTVSNRGRFVITAPLGELVVYDRNGRRCRTVTVTTGPTEVCLDGLPGGVYFVREAGRPLGRSLKLVISDRR